MTTQDAVPGRGHSATRSPAGAIAPGAEPASGAGGGTSASNTNAATLPGKIVGPRAERDQSTAPAVSRTGKERGGRRLPRYPESVEALKMLTLHPVFATPVPRHHVEPRCADGSRLVLDRATRERFIVYSPRYVAQFRAGHRAGRWYLRATSDSSNAPRSLGFATAGAAVEALRAGEWGTARSRPDHRLAGTRVRVIWG
jgi:hypothetical protein